MTNFRTSEQLPARFLVKPRFSLFSYLILPFSQCLPDGGLIFILSPAIPWNPVGVQADAKLLTFTVRP